MKNIIQQQLDACRPDTVDMFNTEMDALRNWIELSNENRAIAKASQSFDKAVAESIRCDAIAVPPSFLENLKIKLALPADDFTAADDLDAQGRLIDREFVKQIFAEPDSKQQEEPWALTDAVECCADVPSGENETVATVAVDTQKRTRRSFGKALLAMSLAALVMLGLYFGGVFNAQEQITITHHELALQAQQWDPNAAAGRWETDFANLPSSYPVCERLNVLPQQWKQLSTQYDANGVVIDLTPAGKPAVYLYVIRAPKQYEMQLPDQFKPSQLYPTGGLCVGAYQQNELTYVLVVQGDKNRFRRIMKAMKEVV